MWSTLHVHVVFKTGCVIRASFSFPLVVISQFADFHPWIFPVIPGLLNSTQLRHVLLDWTQVDSDHAIAVS